MTMTKPTKSTKQPCNDNASNKENGSNSTVPPVCSEAVKAAALISLIGTNVSNKSLLTVPKCMRHAGMHENFVSNKAIQQRVRRLVKKLDLSSVIAAIDESLLEHHGIRPNPFETQEQAFYERTLKTAALICLIDSSSRDTPPLLSPYDSFLLAGLPPMMAQEPTSQPLLTLISELLSLEDILDRIYTSLKGKRQALGPVAASAPAAATAVVSNR